MPAVRNAAAEVAEAAVERDLAARQDSDAERVLGARVANGDVLDAALVEQGAHGAITQDNTVFQPVEEFIFHWIRQNNDRPETAIWLC